MSRFACNCGYIIRDNVVPNEVQGTVMGDKSFDKFFGDMEKMIDECLDHSKRGDIKGWMQKQGIGEGYPDDFTLGELIEDVILMNYFDLTLAALECDECGRLWIQRAPDENYYREYVPGSQDGIKVMGPIEKSST